MPASPAPPHALAAQFFLLRHGQSEANVQGLIASSAAEAYEGYGLTDLGRAQVRASVRGEVEAGRLTHACHLVSSALLRARQSADEAAAVLGTSIRVDARLNERGFGELELTSDTQYARVWAEDRMNSAHARWGVESVESILRRVTELVRSLAASDPAGRFLLCTHGDVASVLLCTTGGHALTDHRDVGALGNAEVRPFDARNLLAR